MRGPSGTDEWLLLVPTVLPEQSVWGWAVHGDTEQEDSRAALAAVLGAWHCSPCVCCQGFQGDPRKQRNKSPHHRVGDAALGPEDWWSKCVSQSTDCPPAWGRLMPWEDVCPTGKLSYQPLHWWGCSYLCHGSPCAAPGREGWSKSRQVSKCWHQPSSHPSKQSEAVPMGYI